MANIFFRSRAACFALWLLGIAALSGCAKNDGQLLLGFTAGEPNPAVAQAIVGVLNDSGIAASLDQPFESAEELTAAVEGGAIDIALLGEPLRPNNNLSMLMPVLPRVLHVLHHESLGNPTLQDLLNAKSIFAGQSNSMGRAIIQELATHHQIDDIRSRLLDSPWVPAPGQPPQVYFIFGGLLSAEARLGFADYQIFSFNESSGSSPEALTVLYPNLRPFELPAGIYPDLTASAIQTVAVESLVISKPDFDAELAYTVVQSLHERSQPLESAYALSRESFAAPMGGTSHTLSMHSGARRFVNKDEPSLLERYAEVFALAATVILGLGTLLTTWLRQRRQRRKDRLDEYFLRLQRLRLQLQEQTAAGIFVDSSRNTDVSDLEAEVLQLLVEERLAVDAALVSFFLMSESVRREIDAASSTTAVTATTAITSGPARTESN